MSDEKESFVDGCQRWLNCWCNGGGCTSLHLTISDAIEGYKGDENNIQEFRKYLYECDPDFSCSGDVYQSLIDTMIDSVVPNPDYEKAFSILMDYFDDFPEELRGEIHEKLLEVNL